MPSSRKRREVPEVSAGAIAGCYRPEGRDGRGQVTIGRVQTTAPLTRPPPSAPEFFLTKDRAKRFAFRLAAVAKERSAAYSATASA